VASVLILGGGIGGITVARRLKNLLGSRIEVTVVDKSANHKFQPSFLSVLDGKRKPSQISKSLSFLKDKKINFINNEVREILPEKNKVKVDGQELSYDYLVIALGAEFNMSAVPGLKEAALNLYSLEEILSLKEKIAMFPGGDIVLLIPSLPYKCPAAPYEAAFLLAFHLRQQKVKNKTNISIYTVEPQPMPTAGAKIGQSIKEMLAAKDINFFPQANVSFIEPTSKKVIFTDGSEKKADLLITVPPHKAPEVVKKAQLTNETGWIPVNKSSLKTKFDNIYAIGDITSISLPGKYKPEKPLMLPKAGVFAFHQGLVVAANIASLIQRKKEVATFNGQGACFLEIGNGTAGFAAGSFYSLPHPAINMRKPSKFWHLYKVLVEKDWFWRWL